MSDYNLKYGILIFGTGAIYRRYYKQIKDIPIVALLDNDFQKHGKKLNGIKIISPHMAKYMQYDKVILMSDAWEEMREQLLMMDVSSCCIISYHELDRFIYEVKNREKLKAQYAYIAQRYKTSSEKKALLISNQMDFTGAPLVLYYAAHILKKNGYAVTFISPMTGELADVVSKEEMDVLQDTYMTKYNSELWSLAEICDLIIINTILIKELIYGVGGIKTKCIWWIHESDERCGTVDDYNLVDSFPGNLKIYGVGKRVIDTLERLESWKGKKVGNLLYGIPEEMKTGAERKTKKIIVLIVGSVYEVKGQDLLADAVKELPDEIRKKCEFWIIGKILNERYFDTIFRSIESSHNIIYKGEKTREEMREIYEQSSVLVCPSRRDSMPVVAVEAMMNRKICIVSDRTGTSHYIEDGINGFLFKNQDFHELSRKMQYVISNIELLEEVGKRARETYERYFSLESFEQNLLDILNN